MFSLQANSKFKKNSKSLTKALAQARSAIHLPAKERLGKFSFRVLYKGPFAQTDKEEEDDGEDDHMRKYTTYSQILNLQCI